MVACARTTTAVGAHPKTPNLELRSRSQERVHACLVLCCLMVLRACCPSVAFFLFLPRPSSPPSGTTPCFFTTSLTRTMVFLRNVTPTRTSTAMCWGCPPSLATTRSTGWATIPRLSRRPRRITLSFSSSSLRAVHPSCRLRPPGTSFMASPAGSHPANRSKVLLYPHVHLQSQATPTCHVYCRRFGCLVSLHSLRLPQSVLPFVLNPICLRPEIAAQAAKTPKTPRTGG